MDINTGQKKNQLWGGRFKDGASSIMDAVNVTIDYDKKLGHHDIIASLAHCQMLMAQNIISRDDAHAIMNGMERIGVEIKADTFPYSHDHNDIHTNIEHRLTKLIGDAGARLHLARSRHDQGATSLRLWVRDALSVLDRDIQALQAALIKRAADHSAVVLPGYIHGVASQPITLGHHLMAYVDMLGRDRSRVRDARNRLNECPLGAGALAGTPFPIDRHMTAKILGFSNGPMTNSLDAVTARDFIVEYVAVCAMTASHLSRLAEDILLWCRDDTGFATLPDDFASLSPTLAHKRRPDAPQRIRSKTGRVYGALMTILTILKALPLAYSNDLHDDKEPAFDTADTLALMCATLTGIITDISFNPDAMRHAAEAHYITATDLVDWLVMTLAIPVREAETITKKIIQRAVERGVKLPELPLSDMQAVDKRITQAVYAGLSLDASINNRASFGGTAPARVAEAIATAREKYLS